MRREHSPQSAQGPRSQSTVRIRTMPKTAGLSDGSHMATSCPAVSFSAGSAPSRSRLCLSVAPVRSQYEPSEPYLVIAIK